MIDRSLLEAIPDVVAFLSNDGIITHHLGGRQLPFLRGDVSLAGRHINDVMPEHAAALLYRLTKRAFATRSNCEALFSIDAIRYEARISPQGPQRALCVIRQMSDPDVAPHQRLGNSAHEGAERRGFMRRLKASISDAMLREQPLALGLIFVEGLTDIGRLIDLSIADRIATTAMQRLPLPTPDQGTITWYVGSLADSVLALVVAGTGDRDELRHLTTKVLASLAQPVTLGDATFHLTPYAGMAVLQQDASQSQALIEHARAAMFEARRGGDGYVQFYSDTLRMLPVARLDVERELRAAVAAGEMSLHYATRHDLQSGACLAVQAYVRWMHPLRGEIAPSIFLPIAAATGLSVAVSRAALTRFAAQVDAIRSVYGAQIKLSFGALAQHLTSGQLERDCRELLEPRLLSAGQLELRISERTLAAMTRPERVLGKLAELGAALIIEEVGRGFSSFSRLAQMPLKALQLDRALVVAGAGGRSAIRAARACRAVAALANSLDIAAVAPGIDDEATRSRLLSAGCSQGLGDAFPALAEINSSHVLQRAAAI